MTEPFNPINAAPPPNRRPNLAIWLALAVGSVFILIIVMTAVVVTLLRPVPEEAKPAVGITKISTTPTTEASTTTTEAPTTTRRVTTTTEDQHGLAVATLLVQLCNTAPVTSKGVNYCQTKPSNSTFLELIDSACTLIDEADPRHTKSRSTIIDDLASQLVAQESRGKMTHVEAGDIATLLGGVLSGREGLCP